MNKSDSPQLALRQHWRFMIRHLGPQKHTMLLLLVLLLLSIGLQLLNPQILRYSIDAIGSDAASRVLPIAAVLFMVVALAQQCLKVLATYVSEKVSWAITNPMRADLARHCLELDISFHKEHTPGEMIERIDGDVTTLSTFFSQFVVYVVGNLILLIGVLIVLFLEDVRIGWVFTGFALFALFLLNRIRDMAIPFWVAARQSSAELYGFLQERLEATEDIRANGASAYTMRELYRLMYNLLRFGRSAYVRGRALWPTTVILFAIGNTLALILGVYLLRAGAITIGTIYLIFYYTEIIRSPLEQITDQVKEFQQASAGIKRVTELFAMKGSIQAGAGITLAEGALSVTFQNVTFGYSDDIVLHGLSFHLKPNQVLGILGRTGSGKTTISRLLLRFYDPVKGAIYLNDIDLRDMHISDVRRQIGIVTQDVQLFPASVRDNLTFFNTDIADEQILPILQDLGLWKWYTALPHGLDTELETGSSGLSAGEAQLLAFARVFLKDPGLIILDEASSRLDPATDQLVEQAIDKLLRNRTGIIIAHRLSTVLRADEIMIIENGRICEYGSREQLINSPNSRFSRQIRTGLRETLA